MSEHPSPIVLQSKFSNDGRTEVRLERRVHRGSIITKPGTVYYSVRVLVDGEDVDLWAYGSRFWAKRRYRKVDA